MRMLWETMERLSDCVQVDNRKQDKVACANTCNAHILVCGAVYNDTSCGVVAVCNTVGKSDCWRVLPTSQQDTLSHPSSSPKCTLSVLFAGQHTSRETRSVLPLAVEFHSSHALFCHATSCWCPSTRRCFASHNRACSNQQGTATHRR
jgi:hypothetical protein